MPAGPAQSGADKALAIASRLFEEGNLAAAEPIARQLILMGAPSGAAWNLVGRAMLKVERPALAVEAFEAALRVDPHFKPARKNLVTAQAAAAKGEVAGPDAAQAPDRYLLIRAFGAGFWADVDHVIGMLLLAEITGRTPIVHWGSASRYHVNPAFNAWDLYFEPVSSATIRDITGKGFDYFPSKWNDANLGEEFVNRYEGPGAGVQGLAFLNRAERIAVSDWHTPLTQVLSWVPLNHRLRGKGLAAPGVPPAAAYRDLVNKYVRVRPDILGEVEAFWRERLEGRKTLAVHLRGTDKITEVPHLQETINQYPAEIDRRLDRLGKDSILFIITDSIPLLEACRERYGDRVVYPGAVRREDHVGLHFSPEPDRRRLGVEVIRDVLLAARCDEFLGLGWSNVSNFVNYFKEWPAGTWTVLGEPGHGHFAVLPDA